MLAVLFSISQIALRDVRNREVSDKLEATPAGKFAISNFKECTTSGGLFGSDKSEPECVNIVVTAAKSLKGDAFAADVGKNLDLWITQKHKSD